VRVRAEAIKLTIFVVVGAIVAVLLYLTLGRVTLGPSTSYRAILTDVSGLESGDVVRVAGVRVGQVDDVSVVSGNNIEIGFHVRSEQTLTDQTQAIVRYENLLGDRYLDLSQPPGVGAPLAEGAVIPKGRTQPALDLDVLLNGFRPLFQGLTPDQINELATNVIDTLQGNGGSINSLLAQTASLTNGLADDDKAIGSLIDNLDLLLGSLDSRDAQLRTTITQMRSLVSGLAADRDPIGASLASISRLTGSLSSLLYDARAPFSQLIGAASQVADVLNRNSARINKTLKALPDAYKTISRVGSHGAFFNFYLCGVQVVVSTPNGPEIKSPMVASKSARCVS